MPKLDKRYILRWNESLLSKLQVVLRSNSTNKKFIMKLISTQDQANGSFGTSIAILEKVTCPDDDALSDRVMAISETDNLLGWV